MNLTYQNRQSQLISLLDPENFALVFSGRKKIKNGDVFYPYRQSSSFLYLTGLTLSDAWLILSTKYDQPASVLFIPDPDELLSRWEGPPMSLTDIQARTGVSQVRYVSGFKDYLKAISLTYQRCSFSFSETSQAVQRKIQDELMSVKRQRASGSLLYVDLSPTLASMRVIKDDVEINLLRQSIQDSAAAHITLMQNAKHDQFEYQLENVFLSYIRDLGYRDVAYPSIVASGENACILHYTDNNHRIQSGDLVLVDAGSENMGYAADITRTFPVGRSFNPTQRRIYEAVLMVQDKVIQMIKPGCDFGQLNQCAIENICRFLIDEGLIKASVEQAVEQKLYMPYYFHSIGHWLGLDVHDVGTYKNEQGWIAFEPGMVLTVEPGLYFSKHLDCPTEYAGIGVRIEDDILVTENGFEVLSESCPKTVYDIEEIRS